VEDARCLNRRPTWLRMGPSVRRGPLVLRPGAALYATWPSGESSEQRRAATMTTGPSMAAQGQAGAFARTLTLLYGVGTYLFV
jgi:hypothetical protein